MVVGMAFGSTAGTVTITDNKSNSWSVPENLFTNFNGAAVGWSLLTSALVSGDTITAHFTTGADCNGASFEYTATAGFGSQDQHTNHATTNATDWFPGAVTTTSASELVVAVCGVNNNASNQNTPVGSWNERRDQIGISSFRGLVMEDLFPSSTGSYGGATTVGTLGANSDTSAVIVTIAEAAAAGVKIGWIGAAG